MNGNGANWVNKYWKLLAAGIAMFVAWGSLMTTNQFQADSIKTLETKAEQISINTANIDNIERQLQEIKSSQEKIIDLLTKRP